MESEADAEAESEAESAAESEAESEAEARGTYVGESKKYVFLNFLQDFLGKITIFY